MEISNQQIIDHYLQRFNHSKNSLQTRKYCLKYFFDTKYYGYADHIFDMKKKDAVDYFDYLNHLDTISFQTKLNKWNVFRSFLQFVMEYYDDFIISIPRYSVKWKPVHKKSNSNKDVIMTRLELERILNFSYNYCYYYYLMIRILAETGMRIGEFLRIKYENVNLNKRYIETEGKTGSRVYYFSESLAQHLAIYMKERFFKESDSKALFLSPRRQKLTQRSINSYIRRITSLLNINKHISSSTFRKTLNTFRKRMGCPAEDRKILLCHKVSDINFNSYVKLNYFDYIQLYDKWNPYSGYFL